MRLFTILHQQEQASENSGPFKLSKWEIMDKEHKMGKFAVFSVNSSQGKIF